jgi:hypothetical protein
MSIEIATFSYRYFLNAKVGLAKILFMKLKYLLFLVSLVSFECSAQLNNLWREGSEASPFDNKRCYEMPNGNILLARMDDSNGIGDGIDILLCYSPAGELLWTYGDITSQNPIFSNFVDLDFDSNNNVYVSGTYFPWNSSYPKSQVTKLSSTGELIWISDFTQQSDWSESAYQIEITDDDRIFLLVRLFYQPMNTIIPYFAEIDGNGDVLTLIADPEFQISYSELFDFNDGFLYAVESGFITKLNYGGEVIWSENFDFGFDYLTSFTYDGAERLVEFKNNKIYVCLSLSDPNTNDQLMGVAVYSTNGTLEQTNTYPILPDMIDLFYRLPLYLEIDSEDNLYVAGTLTYGGGGIVEGNMELGGENRGGKGGGTFSGTFVVKLNSALEQQWVSTFLENDIDGGRYPWGTFLNNDQMAVVYQSGFFDLVVQKVDGYNPETGEIAWEHIETNTDIFQTSVVAGSLFTSTGELYTCGSGNSVIDFTNVSGIYLYKYAIDGVGIAESIDSSTIRVYPNPANEQINISGIEAGSYLRIYNGVGQLCYNERMSSSQMMINLQSWSAGVYQINIVGTSIETLTLVKK